MREIKLLAIVVFVVSVVYWGVEPLAHSVFNPKVAPVDFEFKDLKDFDLSKGDATRGKDLVMNNCASCHNISFAGVNNGVIDMGVVTPDISTAGAIYDAKFLANLIVDPVKTMGLSHKFTDPTTFPMMAFSGSGGDLNTEVADMVAYLRSIGTQALNNAVISSEEFIQKQDAINKKFASDGKNITKEHEKELAKMSDHLKNKKVFLDACQRCHDVRYDKVNALTSADGIKNYLGGVAPDLSTMIRSRGEHKLSLFINDPQKILKGTVMPRVGLTKEAQEDVISYMESIGDSKKEERESLGIKLIIYMLIMASIAYLWKRKLWREVH